MPPLYAAVSYGTECKDAGACKFVCGRVDATEAHRAIARPSTA